MSAVKKKVGYGKFRRNIQSELESDTRDDIYYEAAPTRKFSETSPHVTDISSITKSSLLDEEDSNLYDNPLHSTVLGDEHSAQKKHEALSHNKPKKNKAVSKKNKGVISKTVGPVAKTQKPTSRPLKRLSEMLEREDSSDLESEASINEADPSDNTPLSQAQTDTTEKSESVQSRAKAGKKSAAVSKPRTGRKQAQRLSPSVEESSDEEASDVGPQSSDLSSQSQRIATKESEPVQSRAKAGKKSAAVSKPRARRKQTQRLSPSVEESSDEEASDVESSNPKNGLKPVRKKKNKPSSASSDEAGPSKKVKKLPKNITELDVVLDVFQGFVSEYKETVEPSVCRNAIERLYNKVSDHLLETITQVKECTELKKKSTKIVNAINKKRRHLIEVKSNLIKREIHLRKVQKEYAELKDRYTDLKSGSTFLDDFKDLQMRYLEHRNNNTGEKEKYGLSSLPSLLLEARGILGAEEQLQNINFKLQQAIGN
ncbi:centromere protein U isoform X2 [Polyodon spathula]|uniref:centromere protein U isoform X2 n=1 Tax=Polyodon spathula TaxID=7913 RepID=UPI001B7E8C3E|nr:centromere protein U isoform X2 [Polyodon spathula]